MFCLCINILLLRLSSLKIQFEIYFYGFRAIEEMVKKGQDLQSSSNVSEYTEMKRDSDEKVTFNLQTSLVAAGC